MIDELGADGDGLAVGVCFPADRHATAGPCRRRTCRRSGSASRPRSCSRRTLGRAILFVNDADAAGFAEAQFGAAKGTRRPRHPDHARHGHRHGAHLQRHAHPQRRARPPGDRRAGRRDEGVVRGQGARRPRWKHWAKRLQKYYSRLEALLSPALFIVGGGVSKHYEEFLPLLDLQAPIVPATLRNNAGILGAAALAAAAPILPRGRGRSGDTALTTRSWCTTRRMRVVEVAGLRPAARDAECGTWARGRLAPLHSDCERVGETVASLPRECRGTSGLHRAGRWATPTRSNPRDSATENRPPVATPVRVKRWCKRPPGVRVTGSAR